MPQFEFLTGCAGTGKSYLVQQKIDYDPSWALLTAVTGIASINLKTVTLNAAIGYFDTQSLRDIQKRGFLLKKLREIREQYSSLVIDEVSMMDGDQLTILTQEAEKADLGIYLTGDFLQLPPVRAKWAFESPVWPRFEGATTRLTKVWRQTEGNFLNMLNLARAGSGQAAAAIIESDGGWHECLNDDFEGTTLISKNQEVDEYNRKRLERLPGPYFTLNNRRWGKTRGEWNNIPDSIDLKTGAYVMLLSNTYDKENGEMLHANGDCGYVCDGPGDRSRTLSVRLIRTGCEVRVEQVLRDVTRPKPPKPWFSPKYGTGGWNPTPHWQYENQKYVEGQIEYYPVRLAYASTIHRCQGLSLDRVQFDLRDRFVASPAMCYVAMSRSRTMEGLRIVGDRETFIRHCNVDPKVRRWL